MNDVRQKKLICVVAALLLWTCLASSVRAGIMAGVLTLHDGEATVRVPGSHGAKPVQGAARLGEGDLVTLRRGTATVTFFDNGRASLDAGATYRVGAFGLERMVGERTLLVHQFRERLSRQSLMTDHPLLASTIGTVVPVAETKVRRGGEVAWRLVTTPQPLLMNDQVWTGPRGAARLVGNDGSVAQLRDGTRVYVLGDGIELEAGGCLVNAPGKSLRVRTPSVVVLAQRALFEVAQGQGASIRNFQGRIAAQNRPGKNGRARSLKLAAGQTVEVTVTGAMSRPARFTSDGDARQMAAAIVGQMTAPAASSMPAPSIAQAALPTARAAQPVAAPVARAPQEAPVFQALSQAPAAARLPRSLPPATVEAPPAIASAGNGDLPSPSDFFETATPYQQMIGFADSLQPPPILVPSDEDLRTAERLMATPPAPVRPSSVGQAPSQPAHAQTAALQGTAAASTAMPGLPSWQNDRQPVAAGTAPAARPVRSASDTAERRWAQAPQDTSWPVGLPRPGVTVGGKNVVSF